MLRGRAGAAIRSAGGDRQRWICRRCVHPGRRRRPAGRLRPRQQHRNRHPANGVRLPNRAESRHRQRVRPPSRKQWQWALPHRPQLLPGQRRTGGAAASPRSSFPRRRRGRASSTTRAWTTTSSSRNNFGIRLGASSGVTTDHNMSLEDSIWIRNGGVVDSSFVHNRRRRARRDQLHSAGRLRSSNANVVVSHNEITRLGQDGNPSHRPLASGGPALVDSLISHNAIVANGCDGIRLEAGAGAGNFSSSTTPSAATPSTTVTTTPSAPAPAAPRTPGRTTPARPRPGRASATARHRAGGPGLPTGRGGRASPPPPPARPPPARLPRGAGNEASSTTGRVAPGAAAPPGAPRPGTSR